MASPVWLTLSAYAPLGCMFWIDAPPSVASDDTIGPFVRARGRYRLPAPRAADADVGPRLSTPKRNATPCLALAFHFDTVVYAAADKDAHGVLLALERVEPADSRRYSPTIRGRYVRECDLEPRAAPRMHGEVLCSTCERAPAEESSGAS